VDANIKRYLKDCLLMTTRAVLTRYRLFLRQSLAFRRYKNVHVLLQIGPSLPVHFWLLDVLQDAITDLWGDYLDTHRAGFAARILPVACVSCGLGRGFFAKCQAVGLRTSQAGYSTGCPSPPDTVSALACGLRQGCGHGRFVTQ